MENNPTPTPTPTPGPTTGPSTAVEERTDRKVPVLGASKKNWIATGVIAGVSVLAVAGVWATAPVRHSELSPAAEEYVVPLNLDLVPTNLEQAWEAPSDDPSPRPIISEGLIISAENTDDGSLVTARHYNTGDVLWSYKRDKQLCSLGQAWSKVVATYSTGVGCGDVVTIDSKTGQYSDTRSANSAEHTVPISSNDRIGVISQDRVELWRSDMVRTVEYGKVESPQEADMQPNPGCTISSALTRTELLAVVDVCEDGTYLRFQKVTPEDSRKPEIIKDIKVPDGAQVVSIGQEAAAIYVEDPDPQIHSYNQDGELLARQEVQKSPALEHVEGVYQPPVADLPHHMTWFDGANLYLFSPTEQKVDRIFTGVAGTGVALDDRLLIPTRSGYAVANWSDGKIERTFDVDRGGYEGPISLNAAGSYIFEKRGDVLVAMKPTS